MSLDLNVVMVNSKLSLFLHSVSLMERGITTIIKFFIPPQVSWVRRRDHHLITLGSHTYTNDDRFHVSHSPPFKVVSRRGKEWTLHIKYVQTRDSGVYECQLSTHPPMGILTTLMVIEPVSHITGGPDLYAQEGSDVTLLCRLKNYAVPPTYVFWYHEFEMINYDANRRVNVLSRGGESELRLTGVAQEDSGNYTCVPANARPSSVVLHVITGGYLKRFIKVSDYDIKFRCSAKHLLPCNARLRPRCTAPVPLDWQLARSSFSTINGPPDVLRPTKSTWHNSLSSLHKDLDS
ncbi:zwei Ig domain protein zig-8-like [Penaeus monodon]|uniref:zwei Ig domain protein zig-8-like n=1 Tax=Penaeus monodon TaxID=6687 RepID=UPI0018A7758F|nr:zwei Ig domain protein zig-8-like [Penaeus monodon]